MEAELSREQSISQLWFQTATWKHSVQRQLPSPMATLPGGAGVCCQRSASGSYSGGLQKAPAHKEVAAALGCSSCKDVRGPRNTKATDIPQAPHTGLQSTQQREQMEGRMFRGVQPYLGPNYLEIKSRRHQGQPAGPPWRQTGWQREPSWGLII